MQSRSMRLWSERTSSEILPASSMKSTQATPPAAWMREAFMVSAMGDWASRSMCSSRFRDQSGLETARCIRPRGACQRAVDLLQEPPARRANCISKCSAPRTSRYRASRHFSASYPKRSCTMVASSSSRYSPTRSSKSIGGWVRFASTCLAARIGRMT